MKRLLGPILILMVAPACARSPEAPAPAAPKSIGAVQDSVAVSGEVVFAAPDIDSGEGSRISARSGPPRRPGGGTG